MLRLTTLRSHDQYNTTVYALDDRYRGVFGRRDVLFLSEAELARLGFEEGDVVDVATALDHAREDRVVQGLTLVRHSLPDGCCASYYPETQPLIALEHHDRAEPDAILQIRADPTPPGVRCRRYRPRGRTGRRYRTDRGTPLIATAVSQSSRPLPRYRSNIH